VPDPAVVQFGGKTVLDIGNRKCEMTLTGADRANPVIRRRFVEVGADAAEGLYRLGDAA
jgi:hypothetical protein